jgi:glutathione S-transferase
VNALLDAAGNAVDRYHAVQALAALEQRAFQYTSIAFGRRCRAPCTPPAVVVGGARAIRQREGGRTMKLYTGIGPNPRTVRMFMAEKGIEIPLIEVDLLGGDNRRGPHLQRNPAGQLPCLELDDGTFLAEILPICEYLEEKQPKPPLIGATPEERAVTRMWARRIDLNIVEPIANGFRFGEGLMLFKDRIHCIPQAADDLKAIGREKLAWLNGLMNGNQFIAGNRFTLADVFLFAFLDFGRTVGQPLDPALGWMTAWFDRVAARPSAAA